MNRAGNAWVRAAIAVAVVYSLVGILFAMPSAHVKTWRLAAWAVSFVAYAAHIYFERFRLRTLPRTAACHVACAVALGAFGLALGALVHSMLGGQSHAHHRLVGFALVLWPVVTALPAFAVAFAVSWLLSATIRSGN